MARTSTGGDVQGYRMEDVQYSRKDVHGYQRGARDSTGGRGAGYRRKGRHEYMRGACMSTRGKESRSTGERAWSTGGRARGYRREGGQGGAWLHIHQLAHPRSIIYNI